MPANLMPHRGAVRVTREALKGIPTPPATEGWKSVPHVQLVDALSAEIASRGLIIKREEYACPQARQCLVWRNGLNWQDNDAESGKTCERAQAAMNQVRMA